MADALQAPTDTRLDAALAAVEDRLAALGEALRERDSVAIEQQADALHRTLTTAVDQFAQAAKRGPVSPALRQRLARTSGLVAAQRESLSRATAALDRAMDVLLPRDAASVYSPLGNAERPARGGAIQA
ncbi:MAG: hypothetical protein JSR75_21990 [Proteobacteria bacterium]|nr:hypothetical protein [Pseudomonadota bacterium]